MLDCLIKELLQFENQNDLDSAGLKYGSSQAIGAAKRVVAGEYLVMASEFISALGEDGLEYAAAYVNAAQSELGLQNLVFGI